MMSILSESFFFSYLSIYPGTTWPEPACSRSRSRASSIVGHYQLRKKLPCSGCGESSGGRWSRGWSPSPRRPSLTSPWMRSSLLRWWVELRPTSRPPTRRWSPARMVCPRTPPYARTSKERSKYLNNHSLNLFFYVLSFNRIYLSITIFL